jgi:hypothetical protein
LFSQPVKSQKYESWFTGFSYNAPALLSKSETHWKLRVDNANGWVKLLNYIDLTNYYWLQRSYYQCDYTMEKAIAYAKKYLPEADAVLFKAKATHFRWERALFAGRWDFAQNRAADMKKLPGTPFKNTLATYQKYIMIAKGDAAIVEADIPVLDKLVSDLMEFWCHRMGLNIMMLQLNQKHKNEQDLKHLESIFPDHLVPAVQLEKYYFLYKNDPDYLSVLLSEIDSLDYLSVFRAAIELTKCYGEMKLYDEMVEHQILAKQMTLYLADADVDNHYRITIDELRNKKIIDEMTWKNMQLTIFYDWKTEERLKVFYHYNNVRVKEINAGYLNQLRMNKWLLAAVTIFLVVLMALAFYLKQSLKQISRLNTYRHHFLHALSHDLNATLLSLEQGMAAGSREQNAALLMEHRMMLDDTLQWAYSAHQNKEIIKETCSLSDLVHEAVEQLHTLMEQKKITISWVSDIDAAILLNKNAMMVTLRNLLLNAIKHNVIDGYIHISVQSHKIAITNSTTQPKYVQTGTGSFLINYFNQINHAIYTIYIKDGVAQSEIILSNMKG